MNELKNMDIEQEWKKATAALNDKIIVLDDDPTGTQTVHDVPVYTHWDKESIREMFNEKSQTVYVLTNSRAMTVDETSQLHRKFAEDLVAVSKEQGQSFLLISRGDSTLRGHYPLETEVLYNEINKTYPIDGEIVIPFFHEGGRVTIDDVHYVKDGKKEIPVGETEFANDPTFGFNSSNLKHYIEEKTDEAYKAADILSISIEDLREKNLSGITAILKEARNFNKVIVNAVTPDDLRVFTIALVRAMHQDNKRFLFRTAASFVQVVSGISPKPLLGKSEIKSKHVPGLIVVGSYVDKTNRQLDALKELEGLAFIEWQVNKAKQLDTFTQENDRVIQEIEKAFEKGEDVCVYTSREKIRQKQDAGADEERLKFSTRISSGLVEVVKGLKTEPGFLIVKGGITSSDIGVKALQVKRAQVLGQVSPGIPVWKTGEESRFPGMRYIIFPGNVGTDDTLNEIVASLKE